MSCVHRYTEYYANECHRPPVGYILALSQQRNISDERRERRVDAIEYVVGVWPGSRGYLDDSTC